MLSPSVSLEPRRECQQLVKTKNPLLVTTDLTFKVLIALFAVVSMIIMKNYNKFSTPNLYARSQYEVPHSILPRYLLDENGERAVQTSFLEGTEQVLQLPIENATYCQNASYINWRSPTYDDKYATVHYTTDAATCAASSECMSPITCITGGMSIGEMVKLTSSGLWVKTKWALSLRDAADCKELCDTSDDGYWLIDNVMVSAR